jgi:hypothetical protein
MPWCEYGPCEYARNPNPPEPLKGKPVAQKVQVLLLDDLDGGTADETVSFALDGTGYEIDLSKKNAAAFRAALADYVGHARKAGRSGGNSTGTRSKGKAPIDRDQASAIRDWARKNGHEVSERGRIPARIVEIYNTAR